MPHFTRLASKGRKSGKTEKIEFHFEGASLLQMEIYMGSDDDITNSRYNILYALTKHTKRYT